MTSPSSLNSINMIPTCEYHTWTLLQWEVPNQRSPMSMYLTDFEKKNIEGSKARSSRRSFWIFFFVGCWWEWILEQLFRGFFGCWIYTHTHTDWKKCALEHAFRPGNMFFLLRKFKKTSTVLPSQPCMHLKLEKNISNLSWSLESFHFYRFQDVRTWLKGLCRHELGTQQEIQLLDFSIITNGFLSPLKFWGTPLLMSFVWN